MENASRHPQYKHFGGTGEERFESFMAVPILRGLTRIGVLVLQRRAQRPFTEEDELTCKAVASQLANMIENARFLMKLEAPPVSRPPSEMAGRLQFVKGKPASKGFAYAEGRVVDTHRRFSDLLVTQFAPGQTVADLERCLRRRRSSWSSSSTLWRRSCRTRHR